MRHLFAASAALLIGTVFPAGAQSSRPAAKAHGVRRTPDGHPDLQGIYDLATLTPMERAAGTSLVLTKEEAAKREAAFARERRKAINRSKVIALRHPKEATGRRAQPGMWAGTIPAGWIRALPFPS